jgi:MFS transporter, YNFM family, putative membrane transport protein
MIKPGTKDFWKATIALSIGSLVVFANVYSTQPILPVLSNEFNVSPLQASMSVSFVILALGIALLFYGPLSDAYGRRGIMVATMSLATVVTFAAAISPSFNTLLLFRVLQGVFLAGIPSLALAYIGEEYTSKAVGLAIGIYIAGNTVGGMAGRVISGIVTDYMSWQSTFIVMGIVSLICLLIFVILLPKSQHFSAKPLNMKLAISYYLQHLRNPDLLWAYLIGGIHFLLFVGQFSYITYLLSGPPYLLSTSLVGLLFLTYLAGTVSSPIAGKVTALLPKTICIWIGISIMGIGLFITLIASIPAIVGGLLLNCFGFFFAHSLSSTWVSQHATYAKASASGLYLIFYYIGGSLGGFYMDVFWTRWHWDGVVFGCLILLIITSLIVRKMYQIEMKQKMKLCA